MNKRSVFALSLALGSALPLVLPASAFATEVGYVDMQQILEKSKLGAKVQSELRKDFEPKAKPIGAEEQELRQLQETLTREAALMSKDQAAKKEAELKKRIQAYEKTAGAFQQELMKAQQEKGREVLVPARKAVDAVAKKRKLGVVLERNMAGLVFVDPGLDITDEVIRQMDAGSK
jgi:outer membrane protein